MSMILTNRAFVQQNQIDLVVVGPEEPLVNGIKDYFERMQLYLRLVLSVPKSWRHARGK